MAHLLIDGTHLLAAGAWLGALVPLVLLLGHARRADPDAKRLAARATEKFSVLGMLCAALLLLSGILNASYTVGSLGALLVTDYGRLLAFKTGLFAVIVGIAAVNRIVLTPGMRAELAGESSNRAAHSLRRNALVELALGFGIVAVVGVLGITVPATHGNAGNGEHGATPAGGYVPGLGETMTFQQMRHAKLWLAGRAGNWALAAYELDELKEGFEEASSLHPTHDQLRIDEMVARLTPGPLQAIEAAIQAKDAAQFEESFDRLTAACNACHQAAGHPYIKITRPTGPQFPNQSFDAGPK